MAKTNLLSHKSVTLFSDNRSESHHGYLLSYTEDLFSYCKSWPMASRTYKTFFADKSSFSFLLSKASGSKYIQKRSNTHFEYIRRIRDCAHALISVICPCCRGPNPAASKSVRKILDTNWIMIALHYVNAIMEFTGANSDGSKR